MSLALARKYRPKNFASVAVQSHVSNTLKGAIARGRVAHGYLLCGPRGTGKTTLARVLAMALNCEVRGARADGEPCGECTSCQRIWSGGSSLDVVEMDAASNRSVDDARELRERAMYAPTGDDRYKVYIVDEAHMLTREAWNALLKILEEPPPRVVFVFATTEPQKISQTAAPVLSRLQRFDLKRIGPAEIRDRLAQVLRDEGIAFEADALAMIARAADGGLRDALSLTDQVISLDGGEVTAGRVREALGLVAEDEYIALLDLVAERRAGDVFGAVQRLADLGVDFGLLLTGLADVLRAQLAVVLGGQPPEVSERTRQALEERRAALAAGDLLRMLQLVTELEPRFRKSGQQQLLLETLLVRFALLDRALSLEDVIRGIGGEGGEGGASAPTGRAAPPERTTSRPPRSSMGASSGSPAPPSTAAGARPAQGTPSSAVPNRSRDEVEAEWDAALGGGTSSATPASSTSRSAATAAGAAAGPPPRVHDRATAPPGHHQRGAMRGEAPPDRPADFAPPAPDVRALELNLLVERWDDVVARVRADGRNVLATVLDHAHPVGASASGVVTLQVEDAAAEQAIEAGREHVVEAVRTLFAGVQRVAVKRSVSAEPVAARRVTHQSVQADRMAMLRKKDPVLGAAIDALDLDLVD